MKKNNNKSIYFFIAAFLLCCFTHIYSQDSTKKELVLNIGYYMKNDKLMYIMVHTKAKINSKFQPIPHEVVTLYLDSASKNNFIATVTTDESGAAKAVIPLSLKTTWDSSSTHTFIGVTEPNKDFVGASSETSITKSRISIDTATDGNTKNIIVKVFGLKNGEWLPAKGVEMKIGVSRMGGILSAGDDATYTTDSTGTVTVELKKNNLPGIEKGNIVLVASVEDNDQFGNLLVEKTVPWGVAIQPEKNFFDRRTLWSTRFRTPLWLLIIAYSIGIGIWGTIIYLISQIIKIKRLGNAPDLSMLEPHAISKKITTNN